MKPDLTPPESIVCPLCRQSAGLFCEDRRRRFYQCPNCKLIAADPASHLALSEEKAVYDLHENHPDDSRYRDFLFRLAIPLLKHLKPGMEGLDFGCGPGPTLSGILREAGMHMQDYDPLYKADSGLLQRQYDFVTCSEVVEHFNEPASAWVQLTDLVKPGGWLGVMTSLVPDDNPDFFRSWGYKGEPTHVSFYQPATFAWLGQQFGYRIEQVDERVILMHKASG